MWSPAPLDKVLSHVRLLPQDWLLPHAQFLPHARLYYKTTKPLGRLALKAIWRSFPGITSNIVFLSGTNNSLFSDKKSGPYFLNYIQEGPENKTK